jgi:hypothetical protein
MKLRKLINKSIYSPTGYIGSIDDINKLEQYIVYNFPVLKEYKQLVIATNYSKDQYKAINEQLWKKYFPDCVVLHLDVNRGHNFGTVDLDNTIFDYCKENNIEWVCKSDNDVILLPEILDKEIDEVDFYYLNGIGYGGMVKYNFDNDRIVNEDFYPQTWFYFLNTTKVDYLNDKQYINETYNQIQSIPNYNGKIWEYIDGWSCETFLRNCVERNNLTKQHLTTQEKYINLLEIIKKYNIHDPSHKNIMIEGLCHFQFPDQETIDI